MITRARLMLECPQCHEPKLISVTIIDDVVGPFMCQSCVAGATMARRAPEPEPARDATVVKSAAAA
jgi:hypothetical protein